MKDIAIAGYAGEAGVKLIVKQKYDELLKRFRPDYLDSILEKSYPLKIDSSGTDVHATEGGVFSALYDICTEKEKGLCVRTELIPVKQSTVEICEYYDLNPYRLFSDCYIILCDFGMNVCEKLSECGYAVNLVGFMRNDRKKELKGKKHTEYLNRRSMDELYRVEGFENKILI